MTLAFLFYPNWFESSEYPRHQLREWLHESEIIHRHDEHRRNFAASL